MRALVLGAGGIGGFFGAQLLAAGVTTSFLVRPRRAAQLREQGLVIESPSAGLNLATVRTIEVASGESADVVIVACKAYDLESAMCAIAPVVKNGTAILPLLNGVAHIDRLVRRFPQAVVWGGVAHLGVSMAESGTIRHLNDLSVLQFGPRNGDDERAFTLARALASSAVDASVRDTIEQDMWDKFVFLTTLAGMTCLMRADVGTMLKTSSGRGLILQLLDECRRVAEASGFPATADRMAAYQIQLTQQNSTSKSSMLRDIERNSATEADHILGDMLQRAQRLVADRLPMLEIAHAHLQAYEEARRAA